MVNEKASGKHFRLIPSRFLPITKPEQLPLPPLLTTYPPCLCPFLAPARRRPNDQRSFASTEMHAAAPALIAFQVGILPGVPDP